MNKSESITELAKALCKFQAEVKNPAGTADNPFYKSKYAPLNDILNDVRPLLSKYGLSILQMPSGNGEEVIITSLLMHESGEWIETCPLRMKPVKNDPQGIGSSITYGRRYTISAILGISSEDDDDANSASGLDDKKDNPSKPKTENQPKRDSYDPDPYKGNAPPSWGGTQKPPTPPPSAGKKVISKAQQTRLFSICTAHGVPTSEVKDKIAAYGFASSSELDDKTYKLIVEWAENYVLDNFTMPEEVY